MTLFKQIAILLFVIVSVVGLAFFLGYWLGYDKALFEYSVSLAEVIKHYNSTCIPIYH